MKTLLVNLLIKNLVFLQYVKKHEVVKQFYV